MKLINNANVSEIGNAHHTKKIFPVNANIIESGISIANCLSIIQIRLCIGLPIDWNIVALIVSIPAIINPMDITLIAGIPRAVTSGVALNIEYN